MNNEIKTESVKAEPRKLEKPAREQAEMKREELVTYTGESGGEGITLPPTTATY